MYHVVLKAVKKNLKSLRSFALIRPCRFLDAWPICFIVSVRVLRSKVCYLEENALIVSLFRPLERVKLQEPAAVTHALPHVDAMA
jgi:hypothetical protein